MVDSNGRLRRRLGRLTRRATGAQSGMSSNQRRVVNEMIFNRAHRFVYCPIPKAACTSWKILIHGLEGVPIEEVIGRDPPRYGNLHDPARNGLHYLAELDDGEARGMLDDPAFLCFLFVRNPWTRTLSAYRNKVEKFEKRRNDPTYVPGRRRTWRQDVVAQIRATQHIPEERDVSFAEFVRFAGEQDPWGMNSHYRPQHLLAGADFVEYDFVGRFETLPADYEVLATRLGLEVAFPQERIPWSDSSSRVDEYYEPETIDRVAAMFRRDIELYGYDYPG